MPAQKRQTSENADGERQPPAKQSRREPEDAEEEAKEEEEDEEEEDDDDGAGEEEKREPGEGGEDSDGSTSSILEEKSEYVLVKLSDVRKDVQCPICLGIIRKTRTVMECLHRFCRECIDKSMRMGNNECPACRTHCASRRSLRDDPNFDALIAALYPDIDKYEEEELALHEEEKNRNKQIQASIAQIFQRQSEALVKRRTTGKDLASGFPTRLQRNLRSASSRRRRNSRGNNNQGSEDNEDENESNGVKDSGSADERGTEVRQRRRKRRRGPRQRQPSSSADGECVENDVETGKVGRGVSPGIVWNPEMLAWGRGGTRSHTRHGGINGSSKNSRNNRLSKLVEHLRSLEENDELDVHLMLISLDKQNSLKQPYLCCRPKHSIKHLCEYIAHQTSLQVEEVEILAVKEHSNSVKHQSIPNLSGERRVALDIDPHSRDMQILEGEETLGRAIANHRGTEKYLILGYRQKKGAAIS
ncbi:putative E3 ubiquitin-protein ligase RING1a isoform X1 [Punica granatum]|uniref:E3 ubiquitin-protein ligase RING1a isoform X1 n=1 Tax=Punica granatum TaxID=22663 RepID=A0A6P8CCU6_PUNGR|nr:putative E3 ubiquitin-protein ligase RING1a isoform X1 [Punica granatum]